MSARGPAERAAWDPPEEFEEYRIVSPLGRGAMGRVYLAEDRLLARRVAIKFIATESPSDAARERFFAEARAIARLSHPNVVAVHRVGEVRQRPFLVSEYVRGRSLDRLDKPVRWQEALAIGVALARGLAAAHRSGVLHRDIKPANAIISDEGEVKLLDFGLAKLLPEAGEAAALLNARAADRDAMAVDSGAAAGSGGDTGATTGDLLETTRSHAPGRARPGAVDATTSLPAEGPRADDGGATVSDEPGAARPPAAETTVPRAPGAARAGVARCGGEDVVGTPLYMAPEVWRDEPPSPRADVYALGVLLYELCAGRAPHHGAALADLPRLAQEVAPQPIARLAPDLDPRFAAVIDRCLERDPARRFGSGDDLREALEQLVARRAEAAAPEGNPYRGLLAFEAEHRGLFFGRDAEVRSILDRLRAQPFVLVTGDSGAGKSSLCRAGVLPAVAEGALGEGGAWAIASARLGPRPVEALAAALGPLAGEGERELAERLRAEPAALGRELRRRGTPVLLFLDQLEELCALASAPEAALAAEILAGLLRWGDGVRVLATARSDFLGRLGALPGLGDELSPALYLLRPLSPERLRDAIVGPAAAKGFRFAAGAVEALVAEAARADGGLALLQFTLAELWDARDEARREIPAAALAALGGVTGALARHADGVLRALSPEQRAAARRILLALVSPEGTRAHRTDAELLGPELAAAARGPGARTAARAALDALVRGRLLVAREAEAGAQSAYEIAHEALIRGWGTLHGWLSGDAERRAVVHRIERAAAEWERLGRPADALWGDRQLRELRGVADEALGPRERAFLSASRRMARRRTAARWAAALGVPLLVGAAVVAARLSAARALDRRVDAHVGQASLALAEARAGSERSSALGQDALARFAGEDTAGGESTWQNARAAAAEADRAYARASQELEVALRLGDADRADVRALLGDALYERAALSERERRFEQRDELISRLAAYDDGGERRRRWGAPARLAVGTAPAGAEVTLRRFEVAGGRRVLSAPRALGRTPLEDLDIEPGSFVLSFTAQGRAPVTLPLVLERAQVERVDVALPDAGAVPEGFVYVPPGRFLFGMEEGELRRMLNCQPLHAAETGAYLIARREVTLTDWMAYLRALPPEERARRTPAAQKDWHALELRQAEGGGFELSMRPTAQEYRAREGELLRYPGRARRAVQDWRLFPVAAVSFEDALAYVAWLAGTGRVPGARLCTELEWERAARGADDRVYPGGDRLEPDDANHDVTYGREPLGFGPDEVGAHPASDSPFGVQDLAGNVWEWTVSAGRDGAPVLRGGSWYQDAASSASSNREVAEPTLRNPLIGLRLCATPPAPAGSGPGR
ncbi:Protein kinase [Sorangium cellulosum So ce56]|uniref:non-specific serine/threonine protein kinase n=1 Tax=Sorangium cellulosum (strain So ce56) TaxID=448385 RepID=A9G4J4_SORC5|nr:SUMF1/EgtB/PvdO family nonheme iron enzyme [Sorangium cellulosum]CAN98910.1 Protein kinase [Sorangium cellulosum So ce56]